jgi:2-amino-4-hydroxy-6-hydroxymethyldihydropteridine diphosphokinase
VTRAVIALGANLGDRAATLRAAAAALAEHTELVGVSALFETDPVGGPPDQPAYLNAVAVVDTELQPAALLDLAHQLEAAAGRVRDVRWGPRTLDVDLIAVGDLVCDDPALTLPHPRAHERAFVLAPWLDVDPDAELPGFGPVAALLADLPADARRGVQRVTA